MSVDICPPTYSACPAGLGRGNMPSRVKEGETCLTGF